MLIGADEDGADIGLASSLGESRRGMRRVDTDFVCPVDEGRQMTGVTGARGMRMGRMHICLRKDGSYPVDFSAPIATRLERHDQCSRREGCKTVPMTAPPMRRRRVRVRAPLSHRMIRGRTDVATEPEGSETESQPDAARGIEPTTQPGWKLRACAVR